MFWNVLQQDRHSSYGSPPGGHYGPDHGMGMGGPPNPGTPQQGAVIMVYGLSPENSNCDKLFNLFCLYGNVVRVSGMPHCC